MIRKTELAGQWYPDTGEAIKDMAQGWRAYIDQGPKPQGQILGVVAPHAGWVFSGRLMARVLARAAGTFTAPPKTVIVLGGHLGPRDPLVVYEDEAWSTPLGSLTMDASLNDLLASLNPLVWSGGSNDNTIEVLLPLVKLYFPKAKLWALRAPPSELAVALGEIIYNYWREEPSVLVVASTDLTHYGQAYRFAPAGLGEAGEKFRRENDRLFIDACLALDIEGTLQAGLNNRAACSAGAAAAMAYLAKLSQAVGFEVDSYASSDIMPGPQSVGYAGLEFTRPTAG
jgi:AmmeMemoRadiSam system protein B